MKLFQQSLTSLSAAVLLLAPATRAAECTKRDVDVLFWEQGAVDMMWNMRSWGCGGNWRETKVTLSAPLCLEDGHCFNGWWYYRNHPNQKACWDVTQQIIEQCMRIQHDDDGTYYGAWHSWNGGSWTWGNEYAEGWFYYTGYNYKRDLEAPAANETIERTVYLGVDEHGKISGIEHDFQRKEDGTYKDVASKR